MKIDGWKMKCHFNMVPFQGHSNFRGMCSTLSLVAGFEWGLTLSLSIRACPVLKGMLDTPI